MNAVIKFLKQLSIDILMGIVILGVFCGVFMAKLSANSEIQDTKKTKSNQELAGAPVIEAVKGDKIKLKVTKEEVVDPKSFVKVADQKDGDLTDKVVIYRFTKDGKEVFSASNINTADAREYNFLYTVKNSRGLIASKRINIVLSRYQDQESKEE